MRSCRPATFLTSDLQLDGSQDLPRFRPVLPRSRRLMLATSQYSRNALPIWKLCAMRVLRVLGGRLERLVGVGDTDGYATCAAARRQRVLANHTQTVKKHLRN
jgi:hypothetical protein